MREMEKIIQTVAEKINLPIAFYPENGRRDDVPFCDKQFEGVADDGSYTFFRFSFKGVGYIGVLTGATEKEFSLATLLPAYIESFTESETALSKTDYLKRILLGESTTSGVYKYATKFSLKNAPCFVIVIRVPKMMGETLSVIKQYGGNSLDTAVQISENTCALVKFLDRAEEESQSSVDYAEFLAQSLKEELGIDALLGVGSTVRDLKEVALSYAHAENALRYADLFEATGAVHSYREFVLMKMLEDLPEGKLNEYLTELMDESVKEIFEDEEMLATAEEFLSASLNVSETARNLYVHRNTLLYRLDKIEKITGLNIRLFSDAVSFRVLTVLHRLLGK